MKTLYPLYNKYKFISLSFVLQLIALFTVSALFSQVKTDSIALSDLPNQQTYISIQKISGQVLDEKTNKPVPYTSVQLGQTTIGTSANQYGIFSLKIPIEKRWDTLWVSSIGYKKTGINLEGKNINSLKIILKRETIDLRMVNIRAKKLSAKEILKKAIKAIPNNYQMDDYHTSFYIKDLLNINDTIYRNNEYVGDLIYNKKHKRKYSQVFNEIRYDSILYQRPVVHNFLSEFVFEEYFKDPVRSKLNRLQDADIKLDTIFIFEGMEIYRISFINRSNANNNGFVYINAEDFAIVKYEYSFNPNANLFVKLELEDSRRKNIPMSDFENFSHDYLFYKRSFFYHRDINGIYFLGKINFYLIIEERDLEYNKDYVTELFKHFYFYDYQKGEKNVPDDYEIGLLNPKIPYSPDFWNNFVPPVGDEVKELENLK